MKTFEPTNILDEAPALTVWAKGMPGTSAEWILREHAQRLNALALLLDSASAPEMVRHAMARGQDLLSHSQLLEDVGTAYTAHEIDYISRNCNQNGRISLEDAAKIANAQEAKDFFLRRVKPLREIVFELCAEINDVASFTEFLQLDARYDLGPAHTEIMQAHTNNARLRNPKNIDEYNSERNHLQSGEQRVGYPLELCQKAKAELTTLATKLAKQDPCDTGIAFIRAKLIPRMQEDLSHMHSTIAEMGAEITTLLSVQKRSEATGAFAKVDATQAASLDQRAVRAAATAALSDAENVVSIFGGGAKR